MNYVVYIIILLLLLLFGQVFGCLFVVRVVVCSSRFAKYVGKATSLVIRLGSLSYYDLNNI